MIGVYSYTPAEVRQRFERRKFTTFSGTNRRIIYGMQY
jgi:hypothetical protein